MAEWSKALVWGSEDRGSIPGTALMPLSKVFYPHCSFIVHQINENAICIMKSNVWTCFKKVCVCVCVCVRVCVCVCNWVFTDVYQSDMIIYVWGPTFNVTIRKT